MKIITIEIARTQGVTASSLLHVARWNRDVASTNRKEGNADNAERLMEQARALESIASKL